MVPSQTALYREAEERMKQRQFGAAIKLLDAECDRHPSYDAFHLRGRAKVAAGSYAEAVTDFRIALQKSGYTARPPQQSYSLPAHAALHNLEQLAYIEKAQGPGSARLLDLPEERRSVLSARLTEIVKGAGPDVPLVTLGGDSVAEALWRPPWIFPEETLSETCLNPAVDWREVERALTGDTLRAAVVDNLLQPAALDELRRFSLGSTIWRRPYKSGYIAALPEFGFACHVLFQIAEELKRALPNILGHHYLAQWWGFVYNSGRPGTDIHADESDISLNLWLTPDAANLDEWSGGLNIWDARPPAGWSYELYNAGGDRSRAYLQSLGAKPTEIAYRNGRAILFEGSLFHQTADVNFADGFENHRRNITWVFRRR